MKMAGQRPAPWHGDVFCCIVSVAERPPEREVLRLLLFRWFGAGWWTGEVCESENIVELVLQRLQNIESTLQKKLNIAPHHSSSVHVLFMEPPPHKLQDAQLAHCIMGTSDSGTQYCKNIGTQYRNSDTANIGRYPIFAQH
ncbi:unnamed protein product [Ranitomeya imitator]|uniref:Uncharacterized protein n=1 Tax=Ranitomeya imitator TaxID=111125 RepID=A0ABN9MKC0_9NEOB|nr:unnamed protein product [Ranitomeya imitator]